MTQTVTPTAEGLFEEIDSLIASDPILSESTGVAKAQENIKKSADVDFTPVNGMLEQMTKSVKVYSDHDAGAVDIVSTTLELTSSLLKVASLIPGAAAVARPMSLVLGLAGAITGAFGSSKDSNFKEQMEELLQEANDKLETDLADARLAGELASMQTKYWNINEILNTRDEAAANRYSFDQFTGLAEDAVGGTLKLLSKQAGAKHASNWDSVAETFYAVNQTLVFKAMIVTQGVALLDLQASSLERDHLLNYIDSDFKRTLHTLDPFFLEPTLEFAGITLHVYSLPESQFNLIGGLFAFTNAPEKVFFPHGATQYRFKVTAEDGTTEKPVRVSTYYDFCNKDEAHVLKSRKRSVVYEYDKQGRPVYRDEQIYQFSRHDLTDSDSHLKLWADRSPDDGRPYYRWSFLPREHRELASRVDLRLFKVNPTADERRRHNLPRSKDDRTLLLAGSIDRPGYAWRGKHSDEYVHVEKYSALSDKHPADRWLWILLDRDEVRSS